MLDMRWLLDFVLATLELGCTTSQGLEVVPGRDMKVTSGLPTPSAALNRYRVDMASKTEGEVSDHTPTEAAVLRLEERVRAELLAVRKTAAGLSPHSMARCPVMVMLLGNGDPLVAFTQLESRILKEIETKDDVVALEAASFSLGFASSASTHLDRLNAFGEERGYEARQARRHSDKGIDELARLIAQNWNQYMTPIAEILIGEQADQSISVGVQNTRPRFIGMEAMRVDFPTARDKSNYGNVRYRFIEHAGSIHYSYTETRASTSLPADIMITSLLTPSLVCPAPHPSSPALLTFVWRGEAWPLWQITLLGPLNETTMLRSRIFGNKLEVSIQRTH